MAKRILLSTYSLRINYNRQYDTLLDRFDDKTDFIDFTKSFMEDLFQNIQKTSSFRYSGSLHLTLDKPVTIIEDDRILYGYISSGIGGDDFIVRKDGKKEAPVFTADPDSDVTYRNLFFFLQVPKNKTVAYLIVQKKRDLGAKGSLEKAFNDYLSKQGYKDFRLRLSSLLPEKVFNVMMEKGALKKIDFIRRKIPGSIEAYYDDPREFDEKGTLTTTLKTRGTLNDNWKQFISNFYRSRNLNSTIELNGGQDEYDEIEFQLELNNKLKTFHVLNKQRTQPDVDVTDELEIVNGEPTLESLLDVSRSLINEVFEIKPKDAN